MNTSVTCMTQYQDLATQLMNQALSRKQILANCAVGLTAEIGELHELFFDESKDYSLYVLPDGEDKSEFVKEFGDIMWYVANTAKQFDFNVDNFCVSNIHELSGTLNGKLEHNIHRLVQNGARVAGWIKWHVFHAHPVDSDLLEGVRQALEDICVVISYLANTCCGITMKEVLETNLKKLYKRYPSGKFTPEDSINRSE